MATETTTVTQKAIDPGAVMLAGRLLLASIFIVSALRKLGAMDVIAQYMASHGVPMPHLLLPPATALEFASGALLALGLWTRASAIVLIVWTMVLAFIFHPFWSADAAHYGGQLNLFLFHLETVGGLLYVIVHGGGRFSVDHRRAGAQ